MLKIKVTTAEAVIQETEIITAGRRGLVCGFEFDSAWDGLVKTVVVVGVVKRDINLLGDSITVPGECLTKENFPVRIGVYGATGDGTIAIPTVWANFGRILPSAQRSDIPPDELTPDLVSQIQQNANNALYLAQNVSNRANSGEFNGVSPTVLVSSITGGHEVAITDLNGTQQFDVMDGVDGQDGADGADGADGVGVPAGGTTGQVLKKASGTDYDTIWANESGGGGGGGIFWAEYGVTESAEIDAAYTNALQVFCVYDDNQGNEYILPLVDAINSSSHVFACATNDVIIYATCNSDVWTTGTYAFPFPPISGTPADLGTANNGSSAFFARSDHVHKMPSASDIGLGNVDNVQQYSATNPPPYPVTSVNSQTGDVSLSIPSTAGDVGAIPAPASPSAGDVLTYSGSAWAASAPHYVPAGGNAGAVLAKNSATDYSLYWKTISDYTAAGIIITAAATAAKVCQYSFWDDTHYPQLLYITLASANTASSALTLKVNGKGPYPVFINGKASSATNHTLPAGAYLVVWDGTNFYFQTDGKIPSAALPVYNGGFT